MTEEDFRICPECRRTVVRNDMNDEADECIDYDY